MRAKRIRHSRTSAPLRHRNAHRGSFCHLSCIDRIRPEVIGFCKYGEANVLSTAKISYWLCFTEASLKIDNISSSILLEFSTQNHLGDSN